MFVVVVFCLLQAANLIMSVINSGKDLTEMLVENEETEKNDKEKQEPNGWHQLLSYHSVETSVLLFNHRLNLQEAVPSKSFLSQPETPPPNPA